MFAALHLPDFRLQAALRGAPELWTAPVALVDPAQNTPRVIAVTPDAQAEGVAPGLTPTQALARCAGVKVRHRSPGQETAATEAALQCAYGFSPHLETTAPGLITLDLRGLAILKESSPEQFTRWAGRLRQALAEQDLRARVGIGPTPNLARHAAIWSDTVQVVTEPGAFIAGLPLAALEPSPHVADLLARWGLRTVGELLALGQADVTERLGLEALALFAAASTTSTRPLRLVQPAEQFAEQFGFEEPVETLEPLLFLLRRFTDQLCRRLEPLGRVAQELTLTLRLESGHALARTLRVPEPTRQPDILFRMLHTHLETVRADAPVTGVALTLEPGEPRQRQFSLFETVLRDPHQLQETLGRLTALLGADRVGTPVKAPGHQRDAFRLEPPDFEPASPRESARPALLRPVPWRRLRPAPAATVHIAEQKPVSVQCAVAGGKLRLTVGPWKASGHWWEPGAWSREDWCAETARGEVCRLSRTEAGWAVTDLLD